MKIETLLEKIITGRRVRFTEEEVEAGPYTGNKVIVIEDLENNHKYVLYRSITNFIRFQRWIGKSARADIALVKNTRFKVKSGLLKAIRISTVVEIDKVNRDREDSELDWDYNPEEPPDMRQGHAGTE